MPRAMWEGAVSFGLIVIPVKLYGATEPVDVPLHQVHGVDGGRHDGDIVVALTVGRTPLCLQKRLFAVELIAREKSNLHA